MDIETQGVYFSVDESTLEDAVHYMAEHAGQPYKPMQTFPGKNTRRVFKLEEILKRVCGRVCTSRLGETEHQ